MIKHRAFGLFGGYLILSLTGRPLEFHCTAAVKASRAQQILYGPTLQPYLQAELIGRTLYTHARRRPAAVLTDRRAVLELGQFTDASVAYIKTVDSPQSPPAVPAHPSSGSRRPSNDPDECPRRDGLLNLELDHITLIYRAAQAARFSELHDVLDTAADQLDLQEPFGRIRSAIREAHKIRPVLESRAA